MTNREDCIFCKIVRKEMDSDVIFENDNYVAFFDINPKSKGHTLIIPKDHTDNIFEMKNLNGFTDFVNKVKLEIDNLHKPSGYYIRTNSGSTAGQIIFHTHFHLIPTY